MAKKANASKKDVKTAITKDGGLKNVDNVEPKVQRKEEKKDQEVKEIVKEIKVKDDTIDVDKVNDKIKFTLAKQWREVNFYLSVVGTSFKLSTRTVNVDTIKFIKKETMPHLSFYILNFLDDTTMNIDEASFFNVVREI